MDAGARRSGRSGPEQPGGRRRHEGLLLGIVAAGAGVGALLMLALAASVHTGAYSATVTLPSDFGVPEELEVECDEGRAVDRPRHPQAHDACEDKYSSREAVAGLFAAGGGIAAVVAVGAIGAAAIRLRRPVVDDEVSPGW